MKHILIFFSLLAVVYGACTPASEENKFGNFYKKYYLNLLTLAQAKTLVQKMETYLIDTSTGNMTTFYDCKLLECPKIRA